MGEGARKFSVVGQDECAFSVHIEPSGCVKPRPDLIGQYVENGFSAVGVVPGADKTRRFVKEVGFFPVCPAEGRSIHSDAVTAGVNRHTHGRDDLPVDSDPSLPDHLLSRPA